MKNIRLKLWTILMAGTVCWSCNDLDIKPAHVITGDDIYTSEAGVNAAVATLYERLPIAAQNASVNNLRGDEGAPFSVWNNPCILTGEAQVLALRVGMAPKSLSGGMLAWWDYVSIRYANLVIQEITKNKASFTSMPETYNHWLGEAYFCRAFMYAYMVKCYGGVPIVTEPKSYIGMPDGELYLPRSTEKEVIDFIGSDLDKAMELMGSQPLQVGRADRYIAANLKSRVMLFAACEAKNASTQLDGLIGIPKADASEYYKQAYAAADFAVNNGSRYSLYRRYDDGTVAGKTKNYWNIFVDETSANTERMFVKQYDASVSPNRPENWSQLMRPHGFSTINETGELSVTTEWIELFDDVDGNPFTLDIGTEDNPTRYSNTLDLFAKAQPRLRATILLPGGEVPGTKGGIYEVRAGIYESYPGTLHTSTNFTDKYKDMVIQGNCGMGSTSTNANGCVIWKYQDPDATGQYWAGSIDWIEMRYAEVLLNKAEAAINIIGETVDGKAVSMNDALAPVNELRERAGTKALTTIDEAQIINERRCELAFENRIFWDMKRWRMYEDILQNKTYHALYPYYVYNEGKYIFKKHERPELRYSFDKKAYYAPISKDYINRNPNLLPNNPGY